jgi:hypothetical protein
MQDRLLLVSEDLDELQLLGIPDTYLAGHRNCYDLQLLVVKADIDYFIRVS